MLRHHGAAAVCYVTRMFDAISFAGGGNRCYWQGGFFEALSERFDVTPALAVGASAGAFAGIYSLLGSRRTRARTRARKLRPAPPQRRSRRLAPRRTALSGRAALSRPDRGRARCARALKTLKARTDFRLAVTRLPPRLPPLLGAALGIGAYQLEKHLFAPVHPRFGRRLGFRPEFVSRARSRQYRRARRRVDRLAAAYRRSCRHAGERRARVRRRPGRQCPGRRRLRRSRPPAAGPWCC